MAFRGFFPLNDFTDADIYYNYADDKSRFNDLAALNFEHLYINTTLLRAFTEFYAQNPESRIWNKIPLGIYSILNPDSDKFRSRSYQWYRQHMFTFDKLVEIPSLPGKKFVYAQIYATHQPYVMRADGSFLWPINEDNFNYIPAVEYVSNRLLSVVDEILRKSPTPPVIIIQADHGMGTGIENNEMLNTYYLPGHTQDLYPTITPVNTFRLVLRDYFHQPLNLLPDHILVVDKDGKAHQEPATCNK